jgi:phage gpG-like protein
LPIETNTDDVLAGLGNLAGLVVAGASVGSTAAAEAVQVVVQRKLTEKEHEKDTPTPSRPGEPPAKITGDLTASMEVHPELGAEGLEAELRSDLIYSAIHEFGGDAGRGHASHLPARPYLQPAADESHDLIAAAYLSRWLIE